MMKGTKSRRVRRRARAARRELQRHRGQEPVLATDPWMRRWHIAYVTEVIDYLCDLPDAKLVPWRPRFNALYELTGSAYAASTEEGVVTESQAWARVSAGAHVTVALVYSANPPGTNPLDFAEDCADFLRFLARRGRVDEAVAEGLAAEFEALEDEVEWRVGPDLELDPWAGAGSSGLGSP
jgi:hypothetical protein